MTHTTVVAAGLTRSWTRCYTLGLSREDRDARRMEIESDLWEHEQDTPRGMRARAAFGLAVVSRLVRGMPADLFWRLQMEGPKMQINIPFERVAGGLLLALVALILIAGSIGGYNTDPNGFDGELRRAAALKSYEDNMNAAIRMITGLGLIGAAAAFYATLRERAPLLTTIAAFGLVAAGVLALVAAALHLAFVDLAEEYVSTGGASHEQLLITARTVALVVEATVGFTLIALVGSTYALAVLTARERLVPRGLMVLPALSVTAFVAGGIASAAFGVGNSWIVFMSGGAAMILWLVIAGAWLLLTPRDGAAPRAAMSPAA